MEEVKSLETPKSTDQRVIVRAVSRQDFTTKNYSVDAVGQLSDFSCHVGWRNQLIISRMVNSSEEIEASHISPPAGRGGPATKRKKRTPHKKILPTSMETQ